MDSEATLTESVEVPQQQLWSKVAEPGQPVDGARLHAKVDGRYVTIFKHKGKLSCIDSICHHAGGPLTKGRLQDIEDLGVTVVLCPWHAFMVTIDGGVKAYKGVDFRGGKPADAGWKFGKVVQRPHLVMENEEGVFVCLQITEERCSSDNDSYSALCAQDYDISAETTSTVCFPPH